MNFLTPERFAAFAPNCPVKQEITGALLNYCPLFGINTPERFAHFVSQLSHESQGFTAFVENLNYTAARLWEVFKKSKRRPFTGLKECVRFHRKPVEIGNRVYAGVNGNGPEESGDGFRYRGRGPIHLTGRGNYARFGHRLGYPLEKDPDLAADPVIGTHIACAFWDEANLNPLADANKLEAITQKINGGYNGVLDRQEQLKKARKIFQ